jgi:alkylation response protein AidB-like acyl-CoA dehydrogenase
MSVQTTETVEAFRLRARTWLAENMPRAADTAEVLDEPGGPDEKWPRARELQAKLYSGGFAGICFPTEYGGQGLSPEYQRAFSEESRGYEMPLQLNVPTLSIICAMLLDMGSEEQKQEHIAKVIRGERILVQFLSEPSGGSDLAGLITRADRDGDVWVLNGAKTWSTHAYAADFGVCLARTDWNVPKHAGLTMFIVPTNAPGLTMNRIRMVNGDNEFCEEFFDDVILPASSVVGEVNGGWAVASRQLFHERSAVGGASPYVSGVGYPRAVNHSDPLTVARANGRITDPSVREQVGEWLTINRVHRQLVARVTEGIAGGIYPAPAASMQRLSAAESTQAQSDLSVKVAGTGAGIGKAGDPVLAQQVGLWSLMRQGSSLGGGSTEMSRNIISERVLGMPREDSRDKNVPFNEVRRNQA